MNNLTNLNYKMISYKTKDLWWKKMKKLIIKFMSLSRNSSLKKLSEWYVYTLKDLILSVNKANLSFSLFFSIEIESKALFLH